jgi:hypothetical protein
VLQRASSTHRHSQSTLARRHNLLPAAPRGS